MSLATRPVANVGSGDFLSGRIYENIVTNGGNVHFGDTYLLNDETFKASSLEQQRSALLGALDYASSGARRAQLSLQDIGTESYSWVERTDLFAWLRSPNAPLFHIVGKPASGKSTLMRFLTDSWKVREELANNGKSWMVLHFFFDFRSGKAPANDPVGMVKLFIYQLMNVNSEIEQFLAGQSAIEQLKGSDLHVCIDILAKVVVLSHRNICAFIDGLDEYDGSLWSLCSHLEGIRHSTGMKMCLASRPEPEILKACFDRPSLVMQHYNSESIKFHIRRRLDEISTFEPEIEALFTPDLCNTLVMKADGVILWARLAMDELLLGCDLVTTVDELHQRLESFEPELGYIYERILNRIPQGVRHDAALTLLLLTECASHWENYETLFLQAVKFIKMQCGLKTFLGGRLDNNYMTKRLMIYLPNLIQVVSTRPRFTWQPHRTQLTLTHLSLATHIRKTTWLVTHLNPTIRIKYYGLYTWQSLLLDLLKVASLENVIDGHAIIKRLWRYDELEVAKSWIPSKCRSVIRHDWEGASRGLIEGSIIGVGEIREQYVSTSWRPFAELLDVAISQISSVHLENWRQLPQNHTFQHALNFGSMAWHIVRCDKCNISLGLPSNVNDLESLTVAGKLDLAINVIHGNEAYIERALESEYVTLNVAILLLRVAISHRRPKSIQDCPIHLQLCTRIQAFLRDPVYDQPIPRKAIYRKAIKELQDEYRGAPPSQLGLVSMRRLYNHNNNAGSVGFGNDELVPDPWTRMYVEHFDYPADDLHLLMDWATLTTT